ncbi:MAG: dihydrofolate reductase [Pyrinomonadaceae bacterium]
MIIGIVAISQNFAIGRDGKLPWHYSRDLKFFKRTTVGHVVVMGSTTWQSIAKPLPGRLNVVLSRSDKLELPPEVIKLSNKAAVAELSKYVKGDIFLIGGAKTYNDLADLIDQWIVTDIPLEIPDADTFMPADFLDDFAEVGREQLDENLIVRTMRRRTE